MTKRLVLLALLIALIGTGITGNALAGPLDEPGLELVAHMSNEGGMFDGDGDLAPNYTFGTFVAEPTPGTADFQRVFPVDADEILFITGDGTVWAIADYDALRTLIDARGDVFGPNLDFEISVDGAVSSTRGNVLSRPGNVEDPWVSIDGSHWDGRANHLIVWGENNYIDTPNSGGHEALKNSRDGINVYVRAAVPDVPVVPVVSDKDECKKGGWQNVRRADGSEFKNQGDCVSYAVTR